MKIMSSSSLPTRSMSPIVASKSRARYSPRWRGVFWPRARITVKNASARQMILKSDVSGVMASIPWKSVACFGNRSTAAVAKRIPAAATAGANSRSASGRESESENNEGGERDDGFGRGQLEELEIIHGFNQRIASTAGMMRSSKSLG